MPKTAICNRNAVVYLSMVDLFNQPAGIRPQPLRFLTKTLLIMKLIIFFMLLGLLSATAKSNAQTVTFSGRNVTLIKVFDAVEKQTGYTFFANKGLLKDIKPVSLSVKDMPLQAFLDLAFQGQPVSYEITNRSIFIKEKTAAAGSTVNSANQQPVLQQVLRKEITGTVMSSDGGPLQGVSIVIKGTKIGTSTDASGKFTINAEPNQVLVISYIGHVTQEQSVGARSTIAIVLQKVVKEADVVVVTALGITKKAKSLSYNVQEIKGDDVTANDGSFVNALNGKIAGATINSSSAGAGSSSRVVMRGLKSISGNNNALYVIDGIPMPNTIRGQAEDIFSGAGQTGDFVSNLNPEDIESISVLSGPSAAALYGSAAANGVILITTKKGQKDRTNIKVANSTTFSEPLLLPKFQNTYGPSEVGSYYSWGDKLSTPSNYKPKDFFQTGVNSTSSLALATGSEKNQTYISLGNITSKGIIPNNNYNRYNFTGRNTAVFLNGRMSLDVNFMAGLVEEQNMISQGQYFNPLIAVYLFPPGDDFDRVKAYERYDPARNFKVQFWPYGDNGLLMQNPYWVTERDKFNNKKERYMTTVALKYNLASWINISGRAKMDKDNEKDEKKFAASTNTLFASKNGFYSLNSLDTRQLYGDVLVNINKTFHKDYSVIANVGSSIEDIVYNQYLYGGKLQGVANLYTFANISTTETQTSQTGYHKQKQAVFGSTQVGYKNEVYLDMSARNDWASTLASTGSKSFFYSSVCLSGIITDLLKIKSDKLPYLKVRGSYSEVGNEPDVFLTIPTYSIAGGFPAIKTRLFNPYIKPELTKSFEAGINAVLFKGALKIDATLYSSRTYNQFFEPTLSSASGYTSVIVNAGRVDNKGIEISGRYTHNFGKINWSTYATYSLNRNTIVELLPGWTNPVTGEIVSLHSIDMSGTGSYKMVLNEGGSMGDIYVNTLRVDEHGAIYVDPGSKTVIAEPNKFVYAGNNNPKYNVSWGNEIKWKGISLSVLATARVGGIVVSNTQAIMDAFGVSQVSADARVSGAIVNGRAVPAKEYYSVVGAGASGGIASMYCYSATNIRLGEASIGYDIPVKKWTRVIKGINVSAVGRNLFLFYNKAPFDPELTANTQTYFQGIDYFMMPSLRSYGVSAKFNF